MHAPDLAFGLIDLFLGALFVAAFASTPRRPA
jgi:hypothetical protein